jgi:hypothetical protein
MSRTDNACRLYQFFGSIETAHNIAHCQLGVLACGSKVVAVDCNADGALDRTDAVL